MLTIPREICCNLDAALTREWLVTNGLGGYASGSITGANTRRYHGLLVAARKPPAARTVLLAKMDEEVVVDDVTYRLGTNEYESNTIHPDGYLFLQRVELDGSLPIFHYQSPSFALTKTIWMERHRHTTFIRYVLEPFSRPVRLTVLPLCTYRDFHEEKHSSSDWRLNAAVHENVITLAATSGAMPYHLMTVPSVSFVPMDLWYWRFRHRVEQERGLDSIEDLYLPGLWRFDLRPGQAVAVIATAEEPASVDLDFEKSLERERARQFALTKNARDDFEKQLHCAADQFIVQRRVADETLGTIIAGYHWFGDWGRDTMIALEGLTLVTGRFADARKILRAFAQSVDQGMLPNRFPDAGVDDAPVEYNTVDATLWYFHAIERYLEATRDDSLLRELYPILASIIDWHMRGTRYHIHVDPADGLLFAGETGTALTWMDAKAGDWVVTPRIGKPVEINALWYRALRLMERWSQELGKSAPPYSESAARVRASFERFWFPDGGYLYDVIDTPAGNDTSLRPNQLFALSLADDLVAPDRAKSALDVVTRELLTPLGLRTLAPGDPNYQSAYRGDRRARDAAYHQGIVWAWLIGAYADAHLKVYGDDAAVRRLLEPFRAHLGDAGLGSISEIFEAEKPYRPVGCMAQAWSVAEVLRILKRVGE